MRKAWNSGLTKDTDIRVESYIRRGKDSHMFKGGRKLHKGYWYIHKSIVPEEFLPMVDNGDRVLEHRLIYAKHIGRCLESHEHIHHKDEDKLNNSIDNLEILNREEHMRTHMLNNDYGKNTRKWNECLVCGNNHFSKGLCSKHHPKFWRRNTMKKEEIEIYISNASRDLAYEIYKQLPEEHKYMFTEFLYEEK